MRETLVEKLVPMGLKGIEVYYPEHDPQQTSQYYSLATRYNLAMTGGSDFHGQNMDGIDLGTGRGTLRVSYDLCEGLKSLLKKPTEQ